jgi:hypothetical protein
MASLWILVSAYDQGPLSHSLTLSLTVPSFGGLSPTTEFNDFGCIIPLDCPTSTPMASRRRALEGLPGPDTSPAALAVRSFTDLSPPFVGRGLLPSLDIFA